MGNAKEQEIHHIKGLKGEKVHLANEHVKPEATLYVKGCEDCEIHFDAKCTKIMIGMWCIHCGSKLIVHQEGCRRTKVVLRGRILTNIVEVWKCADFNLDVCVSNQSGSRNPRVSLIHFRSLRM